MYLCVDDNERQLISLCDGVTRESSSSPSVSVSFTNKFAIRNGRCVLDSLFTAVTDDAVKVEVNESMENERTSET